MEKRIEKLERSVKLLEKIKQVANINIVNKDMLLAVISQKAKQVTNITEKKEKQQKLQKKPSFKYLKWVGKSFADGLDYYKLINRVDGNTWKKINDYFILVKKDDETADAQEGYVLGWVTAAPEAVEKILGEINEN